MSRSEDSKQSKVTIWVAVIGSLGVVIAAAIALIPQLHQSVPPPPPPEPMVIQGVVMRDEANPEKRFPISSVRVISTDGLASAPTTTGTDGLFKLTLKPEAKNGLSISLNFQHPDYQEKDVTQVIGESVPYIFYLWPSQYTRVEPAGQAWMGRFLRVADPPEIVSKTFQIRNRGSVRCNNRPPCSPDGKWKAAIETASIDAGPGKIFASGRAQCIAGPCPWTSVETKGFPQLGQPTLTVSVRNWSDTVTYRLSGEAVRR